MNRSALVINPWVTDFKLYDEWMHPLGLYFLISLLKHNNYSVYYCNCLSRDAAHVDAQDQTARFITGRIEKPPVYKPTRRYYKCFGMPDRKSTRLNSSHH
jgi:hypothetical protein